MIKIPNRQSSNRYFPPLCIFLIILAGLFVYSFYQHTIFIVTALIQPFAILFLFSARARLVKKRSETDLQKQDCLERSNLLQADINKERLAIDSLRKKIINCSQLKDLTEELSMALSLADTSEVLSNRTNALFGHETTVILYLFHSKTRELGILASQKGQMHINIKAKKGDIFDEWVIKMLQPLLVEDAKSDFRFDAEKNISEDAREVLSLISAPLMVGNKAFGILRVDSPKGKIFTTDDLRFLSTIADLGAIAVENAQLYEKIEELAIKDSLTGLYLRRYLLARMGEEISRELRRQRKLSILMIDLDRFKQYNDRFGHMAGDILLKTIGMILLEVFKEPGHLVCRYGGEEFAVLLPDYPKEEALRLAEEFRKKIQKQEFILRKQKTQITVSIGVATFPADAQIKEELIQAADNALYEAKSKGRNKVCSS